jgi:hypothetical protein
MARRIRTDRCHHAQTGCCRKDCSSPCIGIANSFWSSFIVLSFSLPTSDITSDDPIRYRAHPQSESIDQSPPPRLWRKWASSWSPAGPVYEPLLASGQLPTDRTVDVDGCGRPQEACCARPTMTRTISTALATFKSSLSKLTAASARASANHSIPSTATLLPTSLLPICSKQKECSGQPSRSCRPLDLCRVDAPTPACTS